MPVVGKTTGEIAHLFTAAPAMLEALETIVSCHIGSVTPEAFEQARAAIDQARRGQGEMDAYPSVPQARDKAGWQELIQNIAAFQAEISRPATLPMDHLHFYASERACGVRVCQDPRCRDHAGLVRCFCGWARSGGDGHRELEEAGETIDES